MSKAWNNREMKRLMRNNGFEFVRQKGDHEIWKRDGKETIVLNPNINKMVAFRLIKEHNLKENHLCGGKR